MLSLAPDGSPANHDSYQPRVSADGLRVVFTSKASNLVAGDTNGKEDIFLWDGRASTPVIVRVSVSTAGVQSNGPSENPSISPDGLLVAFNSTATNLGAPPTGGWSNVYVRHVDADSDGAGPQPPGITYWVSRAYNGDVPGYHCGRPSLSNNGFVAFECLAGNMVAGDTNGATDVFVTSATGTSITRVSTKQGNVQALNGYSQYPSISADGNMVAFESYATNLVVNDSNNCPDIFVKNIATGVLRRLEALGNLPPNGSSLRPQISGNGRYVAFESQAWNLSADSPPHSFWEIYRYDLTTPLSDPDTVLLVSQAEIGGLRASINHEGTKVAYESHEQVFLWKEAAPRALAVEQAVYNADGVLPQGIGMHPALAPTTPGGDFLVWSSNAANLDGATNGRLNVFVRGIARSVQALTPTTAVAQSPSQTRQTVAGAFGEMTGEQFLTFNVVWMRILMGEELREAATSQATVTVGGVAATGVETPNANTLRFAVPPLPAGSNNPVVIRYPDGEVIRLPVLIRSMALVSGSTTDTDTDGLPDWWELTYSLDPNNAADAGAVQANGLTPVQARAQQHHPTATATRYLAEGATNTLFHTRLALANPTVLPATALLRYAKADGSLQTQTVVVPAMRRATVDVEGVSGMGTAEFATAVESDVALVVDRTLRWGETESYGAHAETAVPAPALTWYLAEGATTGSLNLFYLLQNPNAAEAQVRVRYLRPSGAPLEKTYTLLPNSRTNIWVDYEEFPGLGQALLNTDVSAVFTVLNAQPIIVERALYADVPGQFFGAGHESAGITAPVLEWFLAEGATGGYFDLFVLIANPGTAAANIEATYLLPGGSTLTKTYRVEPNSRFNIWVDYEDARLADTAVSTTIRSTNGVPVIVERALWWPGTFGQWYEAHNSPGATSTGTRWALAEGEVGGPRDIDTYILLANTSATAGSVRVTLLFEDRTPVERTFTVAARSRFNVDVRSDFPDALDRRFGAIVESLGTTPAQIVVERAMYWDAGGQFWASGTNALATKLP